MLLTLEQAEHIISSARREAERLGVKAVIAVVDHGTNLIALARMDGAWIGSIQIAIDKAYTARAFDMPTAKLAEVAGAGGPAFGLHTTNSGRVTILGGGYPIIMDGEIVGAIGVSGGVDDQDTKIAKAGLI